KAKAKAAPVPKKAAVAASEASSAAQAPPMVETGAPAPAAAPVPEAERPVLAPDAAPRQLGPNESNITTSRGFSGWLASQGASLAFTTYQAGWVGMIGVMPGGRLSVCLENFARAMGVTGNRDRLYVGSLTQLWRLTNVRGPTDRANDHFDRLYIPRAAQTLGDIDIHELGI